MERQYDRHQFIEALAEAQRLRKVNGYKPSWVYHSLANGWLLNLEALSLIQEGLDFKPGWVRFKWSELQHTYTTRGMVLADGRWVTPKPAKAEEPASPSAQLEELLNKELRLEGFPIRHRMEQTQDWEIALLMEITREPSHHIDNPVAQALYRAFHVRKRPQALRVVREKATQELNVSTDTFNTWLERYTTLRLERPGDLELLCPELCSNFDPDDPGEADSDFTWWELHHWSRSGDSLSILD
jgi:hypothetical protein